jgi:nitroimidazol reductase NimA-like FMN-containing flavoprotein (pyridoxamine 5'-phosphate oxidase superfamily)
MAPRRRARPRSARPARVPRKAAALVTWERVCRVATVNAEGIPHVVPVCHIFHDGRIYFGSARDATKVKNLETNPHATVSVDSYSDAWSALRGVMVQGTARVIGRGGRFRALRARLYRKYPQYPGEAALGESDSVIVEVTPTRVFAWGVE